VLVVGVESLLTTLARCCRPAPPDAIGGYVTRGKGVKLQAYKDGALLDVKTFQKAEGLTWTDTAGRVQSAEDWKEWIGKRGQSGRLPPRGFNKNGRFTA
jgi:topoisomerase-4 subunit A